MKLHNLARSSSNPASFMPAFWIFRSRFRNQGTARRTRGSYESIPRSSPAPPLLTFPQQTTMVPVPSILRCPSYPGSHVTIPIRAHHDNRNLRPRACHKPTSLYSLIFEQNQHKVYREVLITGDLSEEDVGRATAQLGAFEVGRLQMDFHPSILTLYQTLRLRVGLAPIWQQPT